MKIFKIALTGGPCAGKSTMYEKIQKELKKENYKLFLVDETARQLILRGLLPNDNDYEGLKIFQNMVYTYQKTQEDCAYNALLYNQKENICIILCDRGLLDNKAYLKDYTDFDEIVKNHHDAEIKVLDSYDLVLYLTTLAISKPQLYGKNDARFESIKEATELDSRTKKAWIGHHNLKTINTNTDMESELKEIMNIIHNLINNNDYKENEIEYEIDSINLDKYNDNNSRHIKIKEIGYIDNKGNYYKVILRTYKNNTSLLIEINNSNTRSIDESEFQYINNNFNKLYSIDYEEYHFIDNNQPYKVVISNNNIKLYIKEKDKQMIPDNIIIKAKTKKKELQI